MASKDIYSKLMKEAVSDVTDAVKKTVSGNNKNLGGFAKNALGSVEAVGAMQRDGLKGLSSTFMKASTSDPNKQVLNIGKIAASGAAVGVAGRVLGGGGVYRNKNGKTDLVGIPFV